MGTEHLKIKGFENILFVDYLPKEASTVRLISEKKIMAKHLLKIEDDFILIKVFTFNHNRNYKFLYTDQHIQKSKQAS